MTLTILITNTISIYLVVLVVTMSVAVLRLDVAQAAVLAHARAGLADVVELDVLDGVPQHAAPALAHGYVAVHLDRGDLTYLLLGIAAELTVLILREVGDRTMNWV